MSEQVLVVKENLFDFRDFIDGFYELNQFNLLGDVLSQAFFMDRDKAEKDPKFKQIIPYCVIRKMEYCKQEDKKNEIFCYKRTKKGGEKRLHDKYAFGFGGHICPLDSTVSDHRVTYQNGLIREIEEETGLKSSQYKTEFKGLIYDDSNSVGQVHVGCLHVINIDEFTEIKSTDPAISNGGFESLKNIIKNKDSFENWSKIVMDSWQW